LLAMHKWISTVHDQTILVDFCHNRPLLFPLLLLTILISQFLE